MKDVFKGGIEGIYGIIFAFVGKLFDFLGDWVDNLTGVVLVLTIAKMFDTYFEKEMKVSFRKFIIQGTKNIFSRWQKKK